MYKDLILDEIRKLVPEMIARDLSSIQPLPESTIQAYRELIDLLKDGNVLTIQVKDSPDVR